MKQYGRLDNDLLLEIKDPVRNYREVWCPYDTEGRTRCGAGCAQFAYDDQAIQLNCGAGTAIFERVDAPAPG